MTSPFAENLESTLSESDTEAILEILSKIGIQHWLSVNPFKEIKFVNQSFLFGVEVNAWYDYQTRETQISTVRTRQDWGEHLDWGKVNKVSQTAQSELEAIQFTLLHELGHHIHAHYRLANTLAFRQTMTIPTTNAVSNYAKTIDRPQEFFAETFVAFVLFRVELSVYDQLGYAMILRALEALGIEVKEYDFNR